MKLADIPYSSRLRGCHDNYRPIDEPGSSGSETSYREHFAVGYRQMNDEKGSIGHDYFLISSVKR